MRARLYTATLIAVVMASSGRLYASQAIAQYTLMGPTASAILEAGNLGVALRSITEIGIPSRTVELTDSGRPWEFSIHLVGPKQQSFVVTPRPNLPFAVDASGLPASLRCTWTGLYSGLGASGMYTVSVTWAIGAGSYVDIDTEARIIPGIGSQLPAYISTLKSPTVGILPIDHEHSLSPADFLAIAAQSSSGALLENPTERLFDAAFSDPKTGRDRPTFMAVPMVGLIGSASETICYVLANSDGLDPIDWAIRKGNPVSVGGILEVPIDVNTYCSPNDIQSAGQLGFPGTIRIGIAVGNWQNLAATYREFFSNLPNTWYTGPVGLSGNPMPQQSKSMTSVLALDFNHSDVVDYLATDIWRIAQIVGGGLAVRLNGGWSPDFFDEFYYKGYLPGVPSYQAGVREAVGLGVGIVAPYVQSWAGIDYTQHEDAAMLGFSPTQYMKDMRSSFIVNELLETSTGPAPGGENPIGDGCLAGSEFSGDGTAQNKGLFPSVVEAIVALTGANGVYLDSFGTARCFSRGHTHTQGDGRGAMQGRVVSATRARALALGTPVPPNEFTVTMEGVLWRAAESVDLMMLKPLDFYLPIEKGTAAYYDVVFHSIAIPLFRCSFDGVKIGRIVFTNSDDTDLRCWLAAMEVFMYGQVVSVPVFQHLDAELDPFSSLGSFGFDFLLGSLSRFLSGSFLGYHNGTLMGEISGFTITNVDPGFSGSPGPFPNPDSTEKLIPYSLDLLVHAIYRSPGGSLAAVVSNPWVETQQSKMSFSFSIDPSNYSGIQVGPFGYNVVFHDSSGAVSTIAYGVQGAYQLSQADILPGDIVYWEFVPQ